MEASKELVGELLIDPEGAPVRKFDLEELLPVLEKCKYMSSPSIKNDVTAFRYIRRFGVMDGIATLRGCSHWQGCHGDGRTDTSVRPSVTSDKALVRLLSKYSSIFEHIL
jgi:hypothetical protein